MHVEINQPSPRELRKFGLIMATFFVLFFALLIPWIWDIAMPTWPWIVGGAFLVLGVALPGMLAPVYALWMKLGLALGWLNSRIILGILFYLIFVPTGLIMRLFNDPMRRKVHTGDASYRTESRQPKPENLEKPF